MESNDIKVKTPAYDGYIKYIGKVAQCYEKTRQVEPQWWKEESFIRTFIQKRDINSLLDIPVGTGRFVGQYDGVSRVVGVDVSQDMLEEAKKKLPLLRCRNAIDLIVGDVFALGFGDHEFDVTVVWRLFHLIPPHLLSGAVGELARVTRNQIVVQTYPPLRLNGVPWHLAARRLTTVIRSIKALLKSSRLEDIQESWSHIRAYHHDQALIDSLFEDNEFVRSSFDVLDTYEGLSEVRATVYTRL
jgi:ubiquinone/menaquinone biosynthesis C-methylase UbiE